MSSRHPTLVEVTIIYDLTITMRRRWLVYSNTTMILDIIPEVSFKLILYISAAVIIHYKYQLLSR